MKPAPTTVLKTLRPLATLFINIVIFGRGLATSGCVKIILVLSTIALLIIKQRNLVFVHHDQGGVVQEVWLRGICGGRGTLTANYNGYFLFVL